MLFADVFRIVMAVLGTVIGLVGWWMLLYGLWPQRIDRAVEKLEKGIWRYFGIGLIPALLIGGIGQALGPGAIVPIGLALLVSQVGLAAMALMLGRRLFPGHRDGKTLLLGGLTMGAAIAMPFVGWFAIFLFLSATGLGLWISTFFGRKTESVQEEWDDEISEQAPPPVPTPAGDPKETSNA